MSTMLEPVLLEDSDPDLLFFELVECTYGPRREEIIDILYRHHIRLAIFITNKRITDKICEKYRMNMDDFYSVAFDRLRYCLLRFNPAKNIKFSTYVGKSINLALINMFRDNKNLLKIETLDVQVVEYNGGQLETKLSLLADPFDIERRISQESLINHFFAYLARKESPQNAEIYRLHTVESMNVLNVSKVMGLTVGVTNRIIIKMRKRANEYAIRHDVFGS